MIYVSNEAREYRETVCGLLWEAGARYRSTAKIALRAVICPASRRQQDISNRVKVLEDALEHAGVFCDDAQVDQIEVRRGPVVRGGLAIISVWEIEPDYDGNLRWGEGEG